MKAKIIISLIGLLFISGDFVGSCDEEIEPKPDYIIVNVTAEGFLLFKNTGSIEGSCIDTTKDVPIRVDVTEGGGEQSNFFLQTSEQCEFTTETVTIKLYREQQIEIKAYAEQVPGGYTQVRGRDNLSWEEVYSIKDFGETYYYTSNVTIYWLGDQ